MPDHIKARSWKTVEKQIQTQAPPHSEEAEMGVLGSMLIDSKNCISEVIEKLGANYFYIPAHQAIYEAMVEMWGKGSHIDILTLSQYLEDTKKIDSVGGRVFVTSLSTFVPSAAAISHYIAIVKDKKTLRDIISTGTEAVRAAFEEQENVDTLLSNFQASIYSLGHIKSVDMDISGHVDLAIAELEQDIYNKGKKDRLPTGLIDLDRYFNILPGNLVVISAESSAGKTSLAFNIIEHTAIARGQGALVFSIEMPSKELIFRMMASQSKVDIRETTQLGDQKNVKKLIDASSKIRNAPIYIEDDPDITAMQIRAKARRMSEEKDISLIVVDYIQIVSPEGGKSDTTEAQELSNRAMNLKRMARELNIPVIVLSQIEETSGKLFGSRAIQHHADSVLKIIPSNPYQLYIVKQRSGCRDKSIPVSFFPQWTRFENHAKNEDF